MMRALPGLGLLSVTFGTGSIRTHGLGRIEHNCTDGGKASKIIRKPQIQSTRTERGSGPGPGSTEG